ncbi:MAG: ATP-binding protein [Candidatus Gastranaerophilales bacterium]|nr:ATP-binding protein [Candidatus Gastranaerophilales bacterium]MCM1072500.1 ATP-binding protein [Bacteroides sp.]
MENIAVEEVKNSPIKGEKAKKGMTAQTRLIIAGLAVSTAFIMGVAGFSVYSIDKNMNGAYKSFAQVLSKTLAIEGVEVTKEVPQLAKYDALRSNSVSILKSNDDIAFIIFKDNNSNVIYSSKDDYPEQAEKAKITVSSPMMIKNLGQTENVGSVTVGLSGRIMDNVSATTKVSIGIVFLLAWLVIVGIVYMNSSIITTELRKLYQGVKKISSGEFGYKLDDKEVDKEVKELYSAFNDMSEKLSRYNEQTIESLTFERNKLESVLMSIVNGVVVCDNHDKVIMVNNHAKKLLEVAEDDIVGSQIQQFCDSSGEFCFNEKIAEFKDTPLDEDGTPVPFNIEIDKRIIKCLISPMFTRSNSYVGYIIVLIDVTKDVEMDQLRSHFISNVSHELRTPVTVLRSYIDTLYNFGNDFDFNTQREFIGVMNQEIIRLNRMVNDILDFSRYEQQNIRLEKTKQNIMEIVEDCVNQVQVLAKEHDLTISIMKEPDLPEIYLNIDSIQRALMNIVSNAIKYSPDGKRIKIRAERSRDCEYVEISVEDQGPGIPEQYQKKIFDRFFRVENATHTVKGTGLGLHLVKVTIEKHHHGQVFVQSKEGEGSTFGFRLPIKPAPEDIEEYIPKNMLPAESES